MIDTRKHPCFSSEARHRFGRLHLPVAPHCNVQCNFCNRKFDCMNESRPGVSSVVLKPAQALEYVRMTMEEREDISVVGIAGPGDPLANPAETLETLRLIRAQYPEMILCLATNGLRLPEFADEIGRLQVSHVTVTMNCVDPVTGAKIYAWMRDRKQVYRGIEAARLLIERQTEGIRLLKQAGVTVKVNCILMPGVNDGEVERVAEQAAALGADIFNVMPMYPVEGSAFETLEAPGPAQVREARQAVERHLPLMSHCARCRADAAGLLHEKCNAGVIEKLRRCAGKVPEENDASRPYVAVGSLEGVLVNQHLGEMLNVWVFGPGEDGGYRLVDNRRTPKPGGGARRWTTLADSLKDCRALLVSSAGERPIQALEQRGLQVVQMEGLIETGLDAVYQGDTSRLHKPIRKPCGTDCVGNGLGCA